MTGVARATLAATAAVLILAGVAGSGCGDPADSRPGVTRAPDRLGRIAELERRVARLKAKRQKRRAAARQAASGAGTSGDGGLDDLTAGLPGRAGVVVAGPGGPGPQQSGGNLATGPAWSTIKVPIAERVLEDGGGPETVGSAVRDEISAAITLSDNDAAAALFSRLESAHGGLTGASEAVGQMLHQAGDGSTVVSTSGHDGFSTYGQTEWSLAGQSRYMAALAGGCVSSPAIRDYLLGEMGSVGGSDTYGLGSTGLPAKWKGGWGPGTDGRYLVRQMGVLDAGGGQVVVAMAAVSDDGSFESGQAVLNELAARLVARYRDGAPAPTPC